MFHTGQRIDQAALACRRITARAAARPSGTTRLAAPACAALATAPAAFSLAACALAASALALADIFVIVGQLLEHLSLLPGVDLMAIEKLLDSAQLPVRILQVRFQRGRIVRAPAYQLFVLLGQLVDDQLDLRAQQVVAGENPLHRLQGLIVDRPLRPYGLLIGRARIARSLVQPARARRRYRHRPEHHATIRLVGPETISEPATDGAGANHGQETTDQKPHARDPKSERIVVGAPIKPTTRSRSSSSSSWSVHPRAPNRHTASASSVGRSCGSCGWWSLRRTTSTTR